MSKQKFEVEKKKYTVLDGFRFFFFLIISVILASLVFDIILTIVASSKGIERAVLDSSETVQVLSYVINPVIFILYFFIYNAVYKLKPRDAFSDGQKISLLPISVSIVLAIIAIFNDINRLCCHR